MEGLPADFTSSNVVMLVVQLAFVLVLMTGLVAIWSFVRARVLRRTAPFWVIAAEAVLAVPWILFPLLFLVSLAGGHRIVLLATQAALAAVGAAWIWKRRAGVSPSLRRLPARLRGDVPYALALSAVVLFVLWGWVMPFPEAFNGHQHDLVSLLRNMWATGDYEFLAPTDVTYDNNILIWPAPFPSFLSLFTFQGIDVIGLRPMFLLPGLLALLVLQLLRATARELGNESAGSIAFLLVAFSYYAASDFTDITFDLLSPLLITYFAYHAVVWAVRREGSAFPFLVGLAVSFLVRRQVFLLLAGVLVVLLVLQLVPWRAFLPRWTGTKAVLAALLVAPALLWSGVMWAQYDSPFFPHDTPLTKRVFKSPFQAQQGADTTVAQEGEGDTPSGATGKVRTFFTEKLEDHSFALTHYLPVYRDDGGGMVKNVFTGTSLSVIVTLGLLAFLVFARRIDRLALSPQRARRLVAAYLVGFAAVGFQFLVVYPKYPHYLGFLIAVFPALLVVHLARRVPRGLGTTGLAVILLAAGVGQWAVNSWGHALWDSSLANVKFLVPGYGTPVERLARSSGRTPEELSAIAAEYNQALDAGDGRILHMEHEPGALVPALIDREYLGDVLYVENPRAAPIVNARTKREMIAALRRAGVGYVWRPSRPHGALDSRPIFRETRSHDGPSHWVIPVGEL